MKTAFTYALHSLRLGSNNVGQLGRHEDQAVAQVLENVMTGACGLLHSLLLRGDGTMLSFGKAAGGRLGTGNDTDDCYEPHPSFKIDVSTPPKSLSSGSMHNTLVTGEGELLGWGYDSHGQVGALGEPTSNNYRLVLRPVLIDIDASVKAASCSGFHSAAVSETGTVFAWGRSDFGRCGTDSPVSWRGEADTVPIWKPKRVEGLTNIRSISAGGFFTVALSEDPRVCLAFGGNGNGELGIGVKSKYEWQPKKVDLNLMDSNEYILQVATGGFHTCLLTSNGRLLGFGDNHSQQLGLKSSLSSAAKPLPVETLQGEEPATGVSCGPTYTTVVTGGNKLWMIGGAPSARDAVLIHRAEDGRTITLPEKQGAHHIMFFLQS